MRHEVAVVRAQLDFDSHSPFKLTAWTLTMVGDSDDGGIVTRGVSEFNECFGESSSSFELTNLKSYES